MGAKRVADARSIVCKLMEYSIEREKNEGLTLTSKSKTKEALLSQ
jgi:hypothetical protein